LAEPQARLFFLEFMSALDYLHREHSTAHRDIKAENILLSRHNCVRLIDFGFSRTFIDDDTTVRTPCGSPQYVAPEIAAGIPYSKAADLWSAGVLLYAMVVGELPFRADVSANSPNYQRLLFEKIQSEEVHFPTFLSPALIGLLNGLLTRDPAARLTVAKALSHPWCAGSAFGRGITKTTLDRGILASLSTLKVDVGQLEEDIQRGEHSPLTAMYFSLERERLTDAQKDLKFERRPSAAIALKKSPLGVSRAAQLGGTMQIIATKGRGPLIQVRMGSFAQKARTLGKPVMNV
jgi:serine/threonine protein kinase